MTVAFWICAFLLFYIYLGYPLVVWALARLIPGPVVRKPFTGRFSVVISAFNEQEKIGPKIASILSAENAGDIEELIIASDGSTDGTVEKARSWVDPRIRVVDYPRRRGKPAVLNEVIPQCRCEFVVLTDARQEVDHGALGALLANFADEKVGVVSGELVFRMPATETNSAAGVNAYWSFEKIIRKNESLIGSVPGATGALYALRKNLFRPISDKAILDDVAIPLLIAQQGYRCVFEEKAFVYDEPALSFERESVRKRRTIAGNAQLMTLYPEWLLPGHNPLWFSFVSHKILRLFSPFLLMSVLVLNVFLLGHPFFILVMALQIVAYGLVFLGWAFERKNIHSPLVGIPYMFFTLNVAICLALSDALAGRYEVRWEKGGGISK